MWWKLGMSLPWIVGVYLAIGLIVLAGFVFVSWPIEASWANARLFAVILLAWPVWLAFAVVVWLASK